MDVGREVKTIREAMDAMAQVQPEVAFLISPETGTTLTFQGLRQQSILLAGMLSAAGMEKGDKVAFLLDNGLLTAQLFLGSMYGGYVAVPLNVRAGAMQLSYMLDHCDARLVFVEEKYVELLGEALGSVRRDMRVVNVNVDGPLPAFEAASSGLELLPLGADDEAMLIYSFGQHGQAERRHPHPEFGACARQEFDQVSSAHLSGPVTAGSAPLPHQRGVRNAGSDAFERRLGGSCSSLCGEQVLGLGR